MRFTNKEIPNEEERRAVNCYYADLACDKRLASKCRQEAYRLWRNCPKQTKKTYKKEEIYDRLELGENG